MTDDAPPPSRDVHRSHRKRVVRASTIDVRRRTKEERLAILADLATDADDLPQRPRTRGECAGHEGPCPFTSCKHHLYLDVNPRTGSLKINFPDLEPDELRHSCALDVADLGGATLEDVGALLNVTRERVSQLETSALARLDERPLREHLEDGAKRRLPVVQRHVPGGPSISRTNQSSTKGLHQEDVEEPEPFEPNTPAARDERPEDVPTWRLRMIELETPREYPPKPAQVVVPFDVYVQRLDVMKAAIGAAVALEAPREPLIVRVPSALRLVVEQVEREARPAKPTGKPARKRPRRRPTPRDDTRVSSAPDDGPTAADRRWARQFFHRSG